MRIPLIQTRNRRTRMLALSWAFFIYTPVFNGSFIPKSTIEKAKIEFVRGVSVTTYNPEASQTDDTPLITADMSRIDLDKVELNRWCAVSPDLLSRFGGTLKFGDTIVLIYEGDKRDKTINEFEGKWVIHDCMNARIKNTVDLLYPKLKWGFYKEFSLLKINLH